jgi:hypothetical protein
LLQSERDLTTAFEMPQAWSHHFFVNRVRRFFGKPKKTRCFLKTEILDVTFGEKPKKWGKTEKNPEEK